MAEGKKKYKSSPRNEAMVALDEIHEKYPLFLSSEIEKFAPVYYPIALVEMHLDEMTFEDFESVQQAILRLVALGICDHQLIAQTMGLTGDYVFRVLRLLYGYGHMDSAGITDVGRASLQAGKKIVQSQVWQRFQVDALNGTLLKVDQAILDETLNTRAQTKFTVGHLNYIDGMSMEALSTQLTRNNCNNYLKQKNGILNTNVTAINDVRCVEVKYAKCYLVKMRNLPYPIIFAKRYDASQKEMRQRFSWEPLSVSDASLLDKYGFESDIPISTQVAITYVLQLFGLLSAQEKRHISDHPLERAEQLNETIITTMHFLYPFHIDGVYVTHTDTTVPIVQLTENAFPSYRKWIFNLLIGLHRRGEYLITQERLYGCVISLRSEQPLMLETAALLVEKIDAYDKSSVIKRLDKVLKGYEGKELILKIKTALSAL